jgi:hypothetical protein
MIRSDILATVAALITTLHQGSHPYQKLDGS